MRGRAIPILVAVVAAVLLYAAIRSTRDLTDFEVYRTAATRVVHAEPLYRADDGHFQFKYLPAFAVVASPLALLGPEASKAVWFSLSCVWLALFVHGAIRLRPAPRVRAASMALLLAVILGRLFVRELALGQTNVWLGAMIIAALADVPRRPAAAGVLIGAAVFVKPYALIALPWLAVVAGVPALTAAIATIAAGLLLPTAIYGWQGNFDLIVGWMRTVADTTAPNVLLPENVSWASAVAKWIGTGSAASTMALVATAITMAIIVAAWAARRRVTAPNYLEVALLLLVVPLLSPQGWDYVFLLGAPATVLLIDRWPRLPSPWRVAVVASWVAIGFPFREVVGLDLTRAILATADLTVAASILVAAVVWLRAKSLA
jgi:hypothetical protein